MSELINGYEDSDSKSDSEPEEEEFKQAEKLVPN